MTTESMRTEPAGHRIKRILKSYKESAERTLNGPAMDSGGGRGGVSIPRPASRNVPLRGPLKRSGPTAGYGVEKKNIAMERQPEGLTKVKPGVCDIVETNLEGESIVCFEVGGEQRLCMPQILNTVLRDFNPDEVFRVCEELRIFFTRCDGGQLDALKRAQILPQPVMKCGLITYTNAERICSTLLRNQAAYEYRLPMVVDGLRVYHECFGGCKGFLLPEAFTFVSAPCIQCAECGARFAPTQFVSHSHSELENGTIHWGFDPINWRSYLMLSMDQAGHPRAQELLDSLKCKFEAGAEKLAIKQEVDDASPLKRIRYDSSSVHRSDDEATKWLPADVNGAWQFCMALCRQLDVCKARLEMKLPPFLYTDAPVLANPDRIVPYAEAQWTDRNVAPNVSLDPTPYKALHDLYEDDCADPNPAEDERDVLVDPSSLKWSLSLSSTSTVLSAAEGRADSGNVSDDDSEDDVESVLSDKLPAINEDDDDEDDDQICSKVSSVSNARLGILIQALEGEVKRSQGHHDPMHDFMVLQKQHSEIVASLTDSNDALLQRHRYLYSLMEEKVREMEEVRKNQDDELVRLKQDTAMKMREAMLDRCRLMQQIERLSNGSIDSDLAVMATKYKEDAEHLRKQLQSAEELNANLRREITELHRAIDKFTRSDGAAAYTSLVVKSEGGASGRPGGPWVPCTTSPPSAGSHGV